MKFSLLKNELAAAKLFASADASRYVINGVLVEFRAGKSPLLVATDGRRIAVIESSSSTTDNAPVNCVLSGDALRQILKLCGTIEFDWEPGERKISATSRENDFTLSIAFDRGVVEGQFPAWRQVVPKGKGEQVHNIGVCAAYMATYDAAARLLTGEKKPAYLKTYFYGPSSPLKIQICEAPNFFSALMPSRDDNPVPEIWQPDFLGIQETITQEPAKAA